MSKLPIVQCMGILKVLLLRIYISFLLKIYACCVFVHFFMFIYLFIYLFNLIIFFVCVFIFIIDISLNHFRGMKNLMWVRKVTWTYIVAAGRLLIQDRCLHCKLCFYGETGLQENRTKAPSKFIA